MDLIRFGGVGEGEAVTASLNGWDHTIRLISLQKNSYVRYYKSHREQVNAIDRNPVASELFVSSSKDDTVRLWDFRTSNCQACIPQASCLVTYDPLGVVMATVRRSEENRSGYRRPSPYLAPGVHISQLGNGSYSIIELFDSRMLEGGPFMAWKINNAFSQANSNQHPSNQLQQSYQQQSYQQRTLTGRNSFGISSLSSSTPSTHSSIQFSPNGDFIALCEVGVVARVGLERPSFHGDNSMHSTAASSTTTSTPVTCLSVFDAFSGERVHQWYPVEKDIWNWGNKMTDSHHSSSSSSIQQQQQQQKYQQQHQQKHQQQHHSPMPLIRASFSPDGALLACGSHNGNLHVWRMSDGSEAMTMASTAAEEEEAEGSRSIGDGSNSGVSSGSHLSHPNLHHNHQNNKMLTHDTSSVKNFLCSQVRFHPRQPLLAASFGPYTSLFTEPDAQYGDDQHHGDMRAIDSGGGSMTNR